MSMGPGNHGQDDHSMMYTSPSAGQPPNHIWRKEILLARGGQQLDNDVLSLAHGPQTDDRTPMPLAETSSRPCLHLACAPCAPCPPGPPRYPLSDIHLGACWVLAGHGWEGSAAARCLGGNSDMGSGRVGNDGSGSFPHLPPIPSTCTLHMYLPDVPSRFPRASAWCVVGDAMYLPRAHLLARLPCISEPGPG